MADAFFVRGVHAQLMRASGDGFEPHARGLLRPFNDFPLSNAYLAVLRIVYALGAVGPIEAEGQFNATAVGLNAPF